MTFGGSARASAVLDQSLRTLTGSLQSEYRGSGTKRSVHRCHYLVVVCMHTHAWQGQNSPPLAAVESLEIHGIPPVVVFLRETGEKF